MRAREVIVSERIVPSKWVPEKADPAISPVSKYDKAVPVYNPQSPPPMPLTGDVMANLAASMGQIAQIDAAQLAAAEAQSPSQPPSPQELSQGDQPPVAESFSDDSYTTEKQILTRIRQIMYDRKLSGTESNAGELNRLKQQLKDLRSQQGVAEGFKIDRYGRPGIDRNNTDDRYGVYVDGKLMKAYWGKDAAERVAEDIRRRYADKKVLVKSVVVSERMMPASNFAGSDKNKLGPAAHLKGKMKRPARQGDLVGGAAESMREDQTATDTISSTDQSPSLTGQLAKGAIDLGMKAMTPVPDTVRSVIPWAGNDYTYADLVTDGLIGVDLVGAVFTGGYALAALPELIAQRVALQSAKTGARDVAVTTAEKELAKKGAWQAGRHQAAGVGKEFVAGVGQGLKNMFGGAGGVPGLAPQAQQKDPTKLKKKWNKGEKLPVPVDGKTYMLPIVDLQDNNAIVDASSVTGQPDGTKTMTVLLPAD